MLCLCIEVMCVVLCTTSAAEFKRSMEQTPSTILTRTNSKTGRQTQINNQRHRPTHAHTTRAFYVLLKQPNASQKHFCLRS